MKKSANAAMSRKKRKGKKVKAPSVAYLKITWKQGNEDNAFKITNFGKDLLAIERYLASLKGKWKWACLKQVGTGAIYHYYHPKTNLKRLDLKEYKEQFDAYSLYIIHTKSYRERTGSQKGTSKRIYDLTKIGDYWNYKEVQRIDVYKEGKLFNRYANGKFLM